MIDLSELSVVWPLNRANSALSVKMETAPALCRGLQNRGTHLSIIATTGETKNPAHAAATTSIEALLTK